MDLPGDPTACLTLRGEANRERTDARPFLYSRSYLLFDLANISITARRTPTPNKPQPINLSLPKRIPAKKIQICPTEWLSPGGADNGAAACPVVPAGFAWEERARIQLSWSGLPSGIIRPRHNGQVETQVTKPGGRGVPGGRSSCYPKDGIVIWP
jgi:hypothetical protein